MKYLFMISLMGCAQAQVSEQSFALSTDGGTDTFVVQSSLTTGKLMSVMSNDVEVMSVRRDDASPNFPVAIYGRTWPNGFEEMDLVAGEHSGNGLTLDSGAIHLIYSQQPAMGCSYRNCGFPDVYGTNQRFGFAGPALGCRVAENDTVGTSHTIADTLVNTTQAEVSNTPMMEFVTHNAAGFQKMGIYMKTVNGKSSLVFSKAVNTTNYSGYGTSSEWVDIAQIDAEGGFGGVQ